MQERLKELLKKLNYKYRLSVMNEDTLEERISFRLSRMNVYVFFSTVFVISSIIVVGLIITTPLKQYLPGYMDVNTHREINKLSYRADSLFNILAYQERYISNLRRVLSGTPGEALEEFQMEKGENPDYDTIDLNRKSVRDSLLREDVEQKEILGLAKPTNDHNSPSAKLLTAHHFMPPVTGRVSDEFEPEFEHFGIDITSSENAIKSIADGMVLFSNWTVQTGHVIAVQHSDDLVSLYKHNSVLLKKTGNFVKAGEVIALIGNSGENTTGPHVHFEMWHNQNPVDPLNYTNFN